MSNSLKLLLFSFVAILLSTGMMISPAAFADDDEDDDEEKGKKTKTLESECEKKKPTSFDGLFCLAIFSLQSAIADLQMQIDNLELTSGTQGPAGVDGVDGISCWDLNENGSADFPAEDVNGDSSIDVTDCRGEQGPAGVDGDTGPQGPVGTGGLSCENQEIIQLTIPRFVISAECLSPELIADVFIEKQFIGFDPITGIANFQVIIGNNGPDLAPNIVFSEEVFVNFIGVDVIVFSFINLVGSPFFFDDCVLNPVLFDSLLTAECRLPSDLLVGETFVLDIGILDPNRQAGSNTAQVTSQFTDPNFANNEIVVPFLATPGTIDPDTGEPIIQCSDGIDNDNDGLVDFPADPGCTEVLDLTEGAPQCSDFIDNDNDGLVDFPADPGCTDVLDVTE